jgi:light-regulated signal transduction histidine kinase (bacteriophytochrome)
MSDLVSGLLAYSRVRTPAVDGVPVPADTTLDKALASLRSSIDGSQAIITRDPLPAIAGDQVQLEHLFQNLISNAIKFRHEGLQPQVHISCRPEGDQWNFSVRDNGIGIEPQQHEKVFQIFQRLHTRVQYPGAGIGLSICKKIVEQHGGRIWIESMPGGGSTFCFTWPREQRPERDDP